MTWIFILRLLLAGVFGLVIGLDREYRVKEAGFRTHFLVSMGSALLMIVSQYGFSAVLEQPGLRLDPSRIAAQVVSGIGFIGAGTIIFHRQIVRGLTTAASLWATAGIGLAVGAGMYGTAAAATVLALVALEGLSLVFRGLGARRMAVSFTASDREAVGRAIDGIRSEGRSIVSCEMSSQMSATGLVYRVSLVVTLAPKGNGDRLTTLLCGNPDVLVEKIS